jgi:oligosaccharide reducing-end xylanase
LTKLATVVAFVAAATLTAAPAPRNLFAELLGKSDAEITAKIEAGWQQLFHGDDTEERLFYPVGADLGYIADVNNQDVRSEGMSYGMMIAVQMNRRDEFDRIYRWAKQHMYHTTGPRRGYFAWQCAFDGRVIDPGSASDGEEWIATALLLAADRWSDASAGSRGTAVPPADHSAIDYAAEAQSLLRDMLHKPAEGDVRSIFDRAETQVVFSPSKDAALFTDPSYHLPAFYELWAQRAAAPGDRAFWAEAAQVSRAFFHRAAHPQTGLMPEYAHFDGRPFTGFGADRGDFRFDAWRVAANVAIDHALYAADPWQVEQSNRLLTFFASHGADIPNQFSLAGEPLSTDVNSAGMIAMAAVAGLAADPALAKPFVQRLWDMPIPRGRYRYYDGLLYQLGLLQVSGNFRLHFSAGAEPTRSD